MVVFIPTSSHSPPTSFSFPDAGGSMRRASILPSVLASLTSTRPSSSMRAQPFIPAELEPPPPAALGVLLGQARRLASSRAADGAPGGGGGTSGPLPGAIPSPAHIQNQREPKDSAISCRFLPVMLQSGSVEVFVAILVQDVY